MNNLKIIFFILMLTPIYCFPQTENSITIEFTSDSKDLSPGKIHSLVFKIRNNSNSTKSIQPYLTLPPDLKLISELRQLKIVAGAQQILIISFNIPAKYDAGNYNLSLRLVDPVSPSKSLADFSTEITVKEEALITMELIQSPEYVKAGEDIEASYIVRNIGNTTETITLSSLNCHIEGNEKLRLAPGTSSVVNVHLETDENLQFPAKASFYLSAGSPKIENAQVYGFVRVLPVKFQENDLFHRLPVSLTSRYLVKGRNGIYVSGYQFEAKGSGTIDPEGIHKIDFIARGPNQFDLSLLGLYDEYALNYSNKFMELKLGHNSYSMTPLTEYSRYGAGIEQKFRFLKTSEAGILYLSPRFNSHFDYEYGAYANIGIYKRNSLGFYFLKKKQSDGSDIDLYSVTANLQPFERTSVELEASQGKKENISDNAFRLELNTQFNRISMSSSLYHTGKNYPGYFTNTNFYTGYINYYTTRWLTIGLSARQDFANAQVDTLLLTAPFSRHYQALVNIKTGKRMFLKTFLRKYERKDRSPTQKFHYETTSVNTSLSHHMKKMGYSIEGEYGKTTNYLLPENNNIKNTYRSSLYLYFQPGIKHNFQGFITYTNINSFISDQDENNLIYGLTASSTIAHNLRANLQLQNTYSVEEYYRNRNLVQLMIDYQFLKRHKFSLNSFYTIFQNELSKADFSVSLSYSVTFGIPLKQVAEAGTLSGKIIDSGIGIIEGIIINLAGQTALSGPDGSFYFKNLKPGKYNLLIDRSTLDMNDIPDIETPIEVEIFGGQETVINFGITKAARLSGSFELENGEDTQEDEDFIVGNIVLELHRDNESLRIISDENGNFTFPFIRPGKWFLKVYNNGIDKQFILKKDNFDFDFQPGEIKDIKIVVQKKKRSIIFINNSINLSSGEKK
ncbi:MAG: hypothetical protein JW833_14085 [Prolixibacteraceae bacterium]|nr:hypothetical protein [Prolixibacteraceae bacterium]